jgi:hypothetical protein
MMLGSIADWVLVAVSVAAGGIALIQIRAARGSSFAQFRAYVVVRFELDNSVPNRTRVLLTIENCGKTPARACRLSFTQDGWHGVKSSAHFAFIRQSGISMIPPNVVLRYFVGYVDASSALRDLMMQTIDGTVSYCVEPGGKQVVEDFSLSLQDFAGSVRIKTRPPARSKS